MAMFSDFDEQELRYRLHFFAHDARRFILFAGIIALVFPIILFADYALWHASPTFYGLLALRLGIVAVALTAIVQVRRLRQPAVADLWSFVLAMAIALSNNLVILSRPPTYLHHINLELICIVTMFATLPDQLWVRFTPPVVMSLGSLVLFFAVKAPVGLVGGISIVLAYIVVNGLGLVISQAFYQHRRVSFTRGVALAAVNKQLEVSEQRYRQLIDNTHGIIYTIDPAGSLSYVSPSWTRLLGHADSEVVGQHFSRFVHTDDLPACNAFLEQTVRSGEITSGLAYRVFHADGSLRWHRSNVLPCFDEHHVLQSFVGTAIDITELKQSEIDLERAHAASEHANRAKSEFLSLIGHEIRTPMQVIIGFSTLIAKANDAIKIHQYATMLENASHSLLSLVDDILDVSRIEQGRLMLEPIPVHLHELINEMRQMFSMLAARENIGFRLERADSVPVWVQADPVRLRQIFSNLIANAVKFTERGEVVCTFSLQNDQSDTGQCLLCCMVRDTGIGIAPERQVEIFEPFRQQDASITRKYGGSGLGLSIVRSLTEMMGGAIILTSKVGMGSTFTVQLPLMAIDPPRAQPQQAVGAMQSDLRILVVEDSEANQAFLEEALTGLGYQVRLAEDGLTAIALYSQWDCDVMLMDLRLPGMDGIETTRRIREREQEEQRKRVPVIALSADIDQATHAHGLAAGIDAFLVKPAPVERIVATIAQLTGSPEPFCALPMDGGGEGDINLLNGQTQRDLEYSAERCRGFLDMLLRDIDRACQRLAQAHTANDRPTVAHHAHTLKGLCGHLSDTSVRDLADWLNKKSQDATIEELQEAMRLLRSAHQKIMTMAEPQHG